MAMRRPTQKAIKADVFRWRQRGTWVITCGDRFKIDEVAKWRTSDTESEARSDRGCGGMELNGWESYYIGAEEVFRNAADTYSITHLLTGRNAPSPR